MYHGTKPTKAIPKTNLGLDLGEEEGEAFTGEIHGAQSPGKVPGDGGGVGGRRQRRIRAFGGPEGDRRGRGGGLGRREARG